MKKIIALLLVLTMAASLCACGGQEKTETTQPTDSAPAADATDAPQQDTEPDNTQPDDTKPVSTEPTVAPDYDFEFNGVKIVMNADAKDIVAALGEPRSYSEEGSCAFDGLDKTYFYGSFYMQTYPMDDVDYIYCLWIVDDSVETPEGVYIGASQDVVEQAYGAEYYNGTNAYVVKGANTRLTVILEGGVVTSIQYDAVL